MNKNLALAPICLLLAAWGSYPFATARPAYEQILANPPIVRQAEADWKERNPAVQGVPTRTSIVLIDENAHPTVAFIVGWGRNQRMYLMEAGSAVNLAGELVGLAETISAGKAPPKQ